VGSFIANTNYVGKLIENDKIKIVESSNRNIKKDIIDYFEIKNKIWIELKITVDRL
jgi:hypothetical protein